MHAETDSEVILVSVCNNMKKKPRKEHDQQLTFKGHTHTQTHMERIGFSPLYLPLLWESKCYHYYSIHLLSTIHPLHS